MCIQANHVQPLEYKVPIRSYYGQKYHNPYGKEYGRGGV